MFKKWRKIQHAFYHRYNYHIWYYNFHNCHRNNFWGCFKLKNDDFWSNWGQKLLRSANFEVYIEHCVFRRFSSRFLWKACKISRIFNPYWNFWTFLSHFRSISDPKNAVFVENLTWTYIGWHQKLFYGLQSLRNHVISHCYSRRTLISINLLKNQNSIQMGSPFP